MENLRIAPGAAPETAALAAALGADLHVEPHGSVVLLRPVSALGRAWIHENVQAEPWAWFGGALACEPRMVAAVVDGAVADGLDVAESYV